MGRYNPSHYDLRVSTLLYREDMDGEELVKRQGNFQMNDGNGYGDGAYIFYMFTFVCRRFNFWEIEITSK